MRICLVSSGLEERNRRLQPWRYLFKTASMLAGSGHDVHLVSDGYPRLPRNGDMTGLPVTRLASVWDGALRVNTSVVRAVSGLQPDVVLWHLGATSFLHLCTPNRITAQVIGVFTSPVYRARETYNVLRRVEQNVAALSLLFQSAAVGVCPLPRLLLA